MKELIGSRVFEIRMDPQHEAILFGTNKGVFRYRCDADCCSETWIESLENVDALLRGDVREVVELEEVSAPGTRQESDVIYGFKINTNKGTFKLIFRNSSNGYYGGSLEFVPGSTYPHEFDGLLFTEEVTKDL